MKYESAVAVALLFGAFLRHLIFKRKSGNVHFREDTLRHTTPIVMFGNRIWRLREQLGELENDGGGRLVLPRAVDKPSLFSW